jgi:EAL domain-containing protein (putative c-di-GMP-specific phosphodiesterase class I)
VAEGVETIEHLEFLRMNGCRYMQGYYFARPVPGSEIPDIVSDLGTRYQRQASAGY